MFDERDHDDFAGRVLPAASGGLAAAAWFIVLDAWLLREPVTPATPPPSPLTWVPPALATLALCFAVVAPYRPFGDDDSDGWVSSARQCARLWLFVVMLLALSAVYCALALQGGGGDESQRAFAAALALHALATGAATALWVVRRVQVATGAF